MNSGSQDITRLLDDLAGHESGAGALLDAVYQELRQMAATKMAREAPGQTLQATALVHEAWLRLVDEEGRARFENRAHFFAAAAEAMRRILIDRARRRKAVRHGGAHVRVEWDDVRESLCAAPDDELLSVHEALDQLAAHDARKAALVKLHYFAGLTFAEAAEALGVSEPTAKRDWAYARAWLFHHISGAGGTLM